ncbi:MAG: ABC transporter permease [Roseburia sp.]|nr:ABC transporter permease [Roseburia sp.]
MKPNELLRLVWLNITQNKFKVIMTSIGIIVGAATIVMVIAIGKGGQADVADQFKNLNAGAIDISYDGGNSDFQMDTDETGSGDSGMAMMPGGFGGGATGGGSSGSAGETGDFGGGAGGGGSSGGGAGGGFPDGGSGGDFSGGADGGTGDMPSGDLPDFGGMNGFFGGGSDMEDRMNQENITLNEEDVWDIETFVAGISAVTISYTTRAAVDGGELEEAQSYTIAGVKSEYASISNLTLAAGSFLTDEDDENKEKVCVLGAGIAEEIFGSAIEAYGSVLYIDDRRYVVSGVLEAMGTVASGISPDNAIFIPYETGVKYLVGTAVNPTITVIAADTRSVDDVILAVTDVLADSYPNAEFTFTDAGSKMEAAEASNEILTMLLIAMAAIVFVVGGIGIMNVLFVSVKERTNEIGILKAIGCSRRDILLEFLAEAAAISLIGGVLGSLLSLIITPGVQYLGVRVELSVPAFFLALLFAVGTGTIFGFYPAYKASRLIPVDALSAE